jgi:hypothetical protein
LAAAGQGLVEALVLVAPARAVEAAAAVEQVGAALVALVVALEVACPATFRLS